MMLIIVIVGIFLSIELIFILKGVVIDLGIRENINCFFILNNFFKIIIDIIFINEFIIVFVIIGIKNFLNKFYFLYKGIVKVIVVGFNKNNIIFVFL